MSNVNLWGGSVVTLFESGGSVGALMPVPDTRYDRQAFVRALRSAWNLRRRPRVGGGEQQIRLPAQPHRRADPGADESRADESRADQSSADQSRADQGAARWLRGLMPAKNNEPVVVTFDSWYNDSTSTEMLLDSKGTLAVANFPVVHRARKIINSGHSVVVQVFSGPEGSERPTRPDQRTALIEQTVRVWVFNRNRVQAVDAGTLERNLRSNTRGTAPSRSIRFATGWILTGEPGGARAR